SDIELEKLKLICFSERSFIDGSDNFTMMIASIAEIKTSNSASPKNCMINCIRPAPTTFRTPTSFARASACAVDRFTKLIQANIKTAKPTVPKNQSHVVLIACTHSPPPAYFELKCTSLNG